MGVMDAMDWALAGRKLDLMRHIYKDPLLLKPEPFFVVTFGMGQGFISDLLTF